MKKCSILFSLIILVFINVSCFEDIKHDEQEFFLSELNNSSESALIRSKCKKLNNLKVCSSLSANNAFVCNLASKNIINAPSYVYGRAKFVDPINGSDNNNGGVASPFQTITKALSSITDNSQINHYVIILFPGPTVEPAPMTWKPFVSLFGFGEDVCLINQNINYTAAPQEFSRMNFSNINIFNEGVQFNFNVSAGADVAIRIFGSQCNCTWNGGPLSNVLLLEGGAQMFNCTVIDGFINAISSAGFFGNLVINNGTNPIVRIIGGVLAGNVSLSGNANLVTIAILNDSSIIGNAVGGNIPKWETDSISMIPIAVNTGLNLKVIELDQVIANASANLTITKETLALMDGASGPLTVFLPPASSYVGRTLTIKKIDPSPNIVTIQAFAAEVIDGTSTKVLTAQYQFITIVSNGISWSVI